MTLFSRADYFENRISPLIMSPTGLQDTVQGYFEKAFFVTPSFPCGQGEGEMEGIRVLIWVALYKQRHSPVHRSHG